jgi:hypothetical protein
MSNFTDSQLARYVSERYVRAFYNGGLQTLGHVEPYRFAFLEDFWAPQFYDRISAVQPSMGTYYDSDPGRHETCIYYEPFDNEEFVRLVYSRTFRKFLATLIGYETATRPENAYPQLRTIKSSDGGLGIHNDSKAPYNGVAFYNINRNWIQGEGGELVIWEKISEGSYKKRFQFPPIGNSLVVMNFSENSFHSVNKANGAWSRTNILMELQFGFEQESAINRESP